MAKLWLTDRSYSFWGVLIRIAYWIAAIFLSELYLQYYSEHTWSKVGLIIISLLYVIVFIILTRKLDHFFKKQKD